MGERGGNVNDVPVEHRAAAAIAAAEQRAGGGDLGGPAEVDAGIDAAAAAAAQPGEMTGDVAGCALAEDADGDWWVRRPDGVWQYVGGPVYPWFELAGRHGPLRLLDYTPAPPAAELLGELVSAGPDPAATALQAAVTLFAPRVGAAALSSRDVELLLVRVCHAARAFERHLAGEDPEDEVTERPHQVGDWHPDHPDRVAARAERDRRFREDTPRG